MDGFERAWQPAADDLDRQTLRTHLVRMTLVAVGGLAAVVVAWQALPAGQAAFLHLTPALVPAYLGLVIVVVSLFALRWRWVLESLGISLPLPRLMQLWLAARAVGSLIPSGTLAGEPVRAYLLRESAVPLPQAAGAVAVDRALELAGNMIAGPLCVVTALALGVGSFAGTLVALLAAGAGLAVLVFVYGRARRGAPALVPLLGPISWGPRRARGVIAMARDRAAQADTALQQLVAAHPRLVPTGIALSLAIECLQLAEIALLYAVFGLSVPLSLLLLSSVGIGVARAIPVAASLGSLEATQIGIFAVGGRTVGLGLSVGLALRLAETFRIVVGLVCLITAPGAVTLRARRR